MIENLVPGAQYQVVIYLRKGPLIGPPSDPVTFAIGKLPATRIMTYVYQEYLLKGCNPGDHCHPIWKGYSSSLDISPSGYSGFSVS
jgi:hypothetical protein